MKPNIYIGYTQIPSNFTSNAECLNSNQRSYFASNIANASDKRKRQFFASRLLLNQLSEHYFPKYNLSTEEPLTFPFRLLGANNETHSYNISHSDNWVAVAIADQNINTDIGIDIQTLKLDWTPEKAVFFCSEAQVKHGFSLEHPEHYFSQLWSHKEAYFKATQQQFVNKIFEQDCCLSAQSLNNKSMPVFLSLYCTSEYSPHFQLLNL